MDLADVTIELIVDAEIDLPARTNLIVYRLVQELLNNAIKHAEANDIQLSLSLQNDQLTLLYTDDGKGFD
ncbi:sensor histidine kinase [Spirosoma telluris]|uniref:sensor histidine kinase n=1 Tax=Spirosoma telluris TaxID=2183553 RepID=UPI0018DE66CB